MAERGLDVVWIQRADNFAWLTGGIDSVVNVADLAGVASIVVTPDAATVWTTTIEAPRLEADGILDRGFDIRVTPWESSAGRPEGARLGSDMPQSGMSDISDGLMRLRLKLGANEQERFRALAADCAQAMNAAIYRVKPGQTEAAIGGGVADELRRFNITPIVVLIATDERIFRFRHPLPTMKPLDRYAMLVLCGRKDGLGR